MISSIAQTLLNPAKLEMLKLIASVDTINVRHGYADGTWVLSYAHGQVVAGGYAADAYSNGDCKFGETVTVALDELSFMDICSLADVAATSLAKSNCVRAMENVADLDLDVRLINVLLGAGISTLGQLSAQTHTGLLKLDSLGLKSVHLIKEILAEKGLTLKAR